MTDLSTQMHIEHVLPEPQTAVWAVRVCSQGKEQKVKERWSWGEEEAAHY